MIAKYRKDGHPGEWWMTDFTLNQVEGYIAMLEGQLHEMRESFAAVVAERCAPDEQHCSCVPALRERIAVLEADLADAQYLVAKRARVRIWMRDVWLREKRRRMAAEEDLRAVVDAAGNALDRLQMYDPNTSVIEELDRALDRPGVLALREKA